ncbi:tRNA (cytidine(34)-2'-O)-methyltransferase [Maribacter sp. PR1]|uniref:Putative tRNA (cytidine(34)-2'-O)-methyltransferase n=1 Tax=Maribacter cobaltidurans TaxID=1178778 RepID=A0ABU7IXU5_9FLAO|nr:MULTISPECIES: tRNA (cytidine(34)-2'-O)-methyltransferase [Maribacter]MDC6390231.1 tRNA (cytidine(34)-2'-O)-methyltransferase [Maribacter sp. PR1]MEE1977621.1 tRNA (cytidine(34)-2'-O)-methyltransferase [Maribacter cobaltidurans]
MGLHIVLIEPEIPNNTGNIGRLALATGCTLHLVKPFGFEISDKRLRRAGLDYWVHLDKIFYDNVSDFFKANADKKLMFFSSHGTKNYWNAKYEDETFLIFGKESSGLSEEILTKYQSQTYKIPLFSPQIRSLNLSNAVAVTTYEGVRQIQNL